MDEVYFLLRQRGPFYGTVDPWAEDDYTFQQIHANMITYLLEALQLPLERLGYFAGREASLQIVERIEPDVFVSRSMGIAAPAREWDYRLAAAEVLAEPGVMLSSDIPLSAVSIREAEAGRVVTVIELISPGNKQRPGAIGAYRRRREKLLLDSQVNVVEIDLTRSVKRLVLDEAASQSAYHAIVYLTGGFPYFIGMAFSAPLVRIAVPLRNQVIPIELHPIYERAYQSARVAVQLQERGRYTEAYLPFPSMLTDAQIEQALAAVAAWQAELARHKAG